MIGRTISHYRILERLGGGGMGEVYKAEDERLKRVVALKFLPAQMTRDKVAKERFMQEAQAASALDHRNICTIHEIDETEDGQLFIVMACYDGETLKDRIEHHSLNPVKALDVAIQVGEGLSEAHRKGIVHRDIKPANLIVTRDETVKIVDFGIAKLERQTHLTTDGMRLGTVAYMSPEQARGKQVDHTTDVWSLGVVLYEMLTGQRPFRSDFDLGVVYSIVHEDPDAVTALLPALSPEFEGVLQKALMKDKAERYQSMEEFVADLRALRSDSVPVVSPLASTLRGAPRSVAVLPFLDLSATRDQEYFCDGMSEELISALSKIPGLHVASRTSTFAFKGKEHDIQHIGQQLKVTHVLEGSVRKAGDRLRISTQLITVKDGYQLWSEQYDRQLDDVFAIQDDIARSIVQALKVRLGDQTTGQLFRRRAENLEAYHLYLKGQYFWSQRHKGGMRKAMEYYNQAIALEPTYALAYAGLANCFVTLGAFTYLSPQDAFPKARAAAQKALQIDEAVAEAHSALATVALFGDWDVRTAEQEHRRGLELDRAYATGRSWYAVFLSVTGRASAAVDEQRKALSLDPLSLMINSLLGAELYYARQYDDAREQLLKTIELDPGFGTAHSYLGLVYEELARYDDAIREFEQSRELMDLPMVVANLAHAHGVAGNRAIAEQLLAELAETATQRFVSPFFVAAVYAGLKEPDRAFDWLAKAMESRDGWIPYLHCDPRFDVLRSDERFSSLVARIGVVR